MANKEKRICSVEEVDQILEKALNIEQTNTVEALRLSEQALSLAKKCDYTLQRAKAYIRMGRCYWINGTFDDAIDVLNQAINLSTMIDASYEEAEAYIALGNVYITINLVDQAINQYNKAYAIINEHDYPTLEAKILNNMGTIHEELNNYDKALDYYRKSVETTQKIGDAYGSAIAKFNTGNMYLKMDNLEEAKTYILEAIDFSEKDNKIILLAHSYHALGKYYQEVHQYQESIENLKLSLKLAQESKDMSIQVQIYIELARSHDYINDYDFVHTYFDKAYALAVDLKMVEVIPRIHEEVALFYQKNNQIDDMNRNFRAYYEANKKLEDKRRKERLKTIEYQSRLKDSIKETETYKQLSNQLRKSYDQMHVLSEIGQSLTSILDLNTIFDKLYAQVNRLMDAHSLGVGLYDSSIKAIRFDLFIEDNVRHGSFSLSMDNKKSWNVWTLKNKKTIRIDNMKKEYKHYIEGTAQTKGEPMSSAIYAPLIVENEAIGVLTVQSKKINAYSDTQEDLLNTLASYLAIAIKNAQKSVELEKLNKRLKRLSEQDGLTGIPNRRMFNDTYLSYWHEQREKQENLTVMFIDVDHFKAFNDQYGHLIGDEVIKAVASHLEKERMSDDHFLARYGGDEFVLVAKGLTEDAARKYAEKINTSFKALSQALDLKETLTVSIGCVCTIPSSDLSPEAFIDKADQQLYRSKEAGRNQVHVKCH